MKFCFTLGLTLVFVSCATDQSGPKKMSSEDRARSLVQVAQGALMENDATSALKFLFEAETYNSNNADLHHLKAMAYYMKGLYPEAGVSAKRAIELNPKNSDALNTYGRILLDQGKLPESEKYLKQATSDVTYQDVYKAQTNLGIIYYRTNRFEESEKELDKAISSNESFACVAYYYRGNIHLKKNKLNSAIKDYKKASRANTCGGFPEAQLALALTNASAKNYDEAKKLYLEIQKSFPDSKYSDQAMRKLQELP